MRHEELVDQLRTILANGAERTVQAEQIAAAIAQGGAYHWVGLYDVTDRAITLRAWYGAGPPAFPSFPVTQGLSGAAVRSRSTVIAHDVRATPEYLTTFGNSRAEIIVPIIDQDQVVGTLDVESVHENAFTDADRQLLEACAAVICRLWTQPNAG